MAIVKKKIVIKNKLGLHARPAAMFVQIANKFDSSITVRKDSQEVNGKSIMGILMLEAGKSSTVIIKANGKDAEDAVCELEKLLISDGEDLYLRPGTGKEGKSK